MIDYETWYGPFMKQLAINHTRSELEKKLGVEQASAARGAKAHLRAIEATTSMAGQSARRANTRNAMTGHADNAMYIRGALSIYDNFPQFTKEGEAAQNGTGASRAISVPGGSPDASLTVPTQIAVREETQREVVSGKPGV